MPIRPEIEPHVKKILRKYATFSDFDSLIDSSPDPLIVYQ